MSAFIIICNYNHQFMFKLQLNDNNYKRLNSISSNFRGTH